MRKEELFEVLGKIDGKYVKEAKNNVKKSKNNFSWWKRTDEECRTRNNILSKWKI